MLLVFALFVLFFALGWSAARLFAQWNTQTEEE